MDPTEAGRAFSRAGLGDSVRPTPHLSQQGTSRIIDHLNPASEEEVAGDDGLSHHGDPEVEGVDDDEPEVEVLEEGRPEDGRGEGPRTLKAPRAPTQREIDAHMATHLPHAAWCDICMKGRGRNSPHWGTPSRWARRREGSGASEDGDPECSGPEGAATASGAAPEE